MPTPKPTRHHEASATQRLVALLPGINRRSCIGSRRQAAVSGGDDKPLLALLRTNLVHDNRSTAIVDNHGNRATADTETRRPSDLYAGALEASHQTAVRIALVHGALAPTTHHNGER